ncbi:hypothetical protein RJT34_31081 [Clitoria ternatea]|uniref:Uncharacterized protein n=1 Tax=Clitoria ternatea TaxID=43366 RepID=A0AAN9EY17_CLITE
MRNSWIEHLHFSAPDILSCMDMNSDMMLAWMSDGHASGILLVVGNTSSKRSKESGQDLQQVSNEMFISMHNPELLARWLPLNVVPLLS